MLEQARLAHKATDLGARRHVNFFYVRSADSPPVRANTSDARAPYVSCRRSKCEYGLLTLKPSTEQGGGRTRLPLPPLPRPSQCDISNPDHGTSPRLKGNTSSDPANLPNLSPSSHEGVTGTRLHCDGRDSDDRRHHYDLSDATETSTAELPVHSGIKWFVRDANNNGIADAVILSEASTLTLQQRETVTTGSMYVYAYTTRDGDYWRLLVAGTYRVTASWGGWSQEKTCTAANRAVGRCDFVLGAPPTQPPGTDTPPRRWSGDDRPHLVRSASMLGRVDSARQRWKKQVEVQRVNVYDRRNILS
ncbi:hypothetical protein Bbelb_240250 [Branchiostoma belcheri]|nr:hypothetical protein Bbelb_240250 [Branchiostoma belcheri]